MEIADDDIVYRRVPGASSTVDQATGQRRPTSDCFRDSTSPDPSPMSGVLASLLGDRSPDSLVPGPGGDRLVELRVGDLRALGLDIELAPIDDEDAHVHVVGEKSRALRQQIATIARYLA